MSSVLLREWHRYTSDALNWRFSKMTRQDDGQPWHPDHVSKRFKKLAAQAGVPVVTLQRAGGTPATR